MITGRLALIQVAAITVDGIWRSTYANLICPCLGSLFIAWTTIGIAQQPAQPATLAKIPVKEVSVFKDGHAFVMHEGSLPVDASGAIVMDYLPAPVLGTFWAYSAHPNVRVQAMTAGQHRITVEKTALKMAELLESNIGADVIITEKPVGTTPDSNTYFHGRPWRCVRNALRVNADSYMDIGLSGSIKLTNYRKAAVSLEVTREVLGGVKSATNNGQIEKLNALAEYPLWWRQYNWPFWWHQVNAVGRITWNLTLSPGQSIDLNYEWQYYWR